MTPKHLSIAIAGLALAALLAVGLFQLASKSGAPTRLEKLTAAQVQAGLVGSPAPLAALHAQAGELLDGGARALRARLAVLHGYPVVINKWASWCQPCRAEFGAFQHASVLQGRAVAFIGIDSGDSSRSAATSFLRSFPMSYPSYYDRSGHLGEAITDSSFIPVTVFYDSHGKEYIHQGPYQSLAKLEHDVERYALDHA